MSDNGIDPLVAISEQNHPVADLARDFLACETEWSIDDRFLKRTKIFYQGQDMSDDEAFSFENLTYSFGSLETRNVRLVSIRPFYFRGFRDLESPIILDANLVSVEGRNSSGKTSLAEAIEWLLTGNIQRREQGDPAEYAGFIANRFRPERQKTWVECILAVDGTTTKIRRVLVEDYGSSKNSHSTTQLFIDEKEIKDSTDVLADYFSGVAPLLMQHTLREFVLESPDKRPRYFERLLNIDEISDLIADAQVSHLRQPDFPRPGGGTALGDWQHFTQSVGGTRFRTVEQYSRLDRSVLRKEICDALVRVAVDKFDAKCESNIDSCITVIKTMQERELQRSFPLLQNFRPEVNLTQTTFDQFSPDSQNPRLLRLEKARTDYVSSLESQKQISDANISIARALEVLRKSGLINEEDQQTCPICEFQEVPTLSRDRIDEIESWDPIRELVERAKERFESAITECRQKIEDLISLRENLVPPEIPQPSITDIGEVASSDSFRALVAAHVDAKQQLQTFDSKALMALAELEKCDPDLDICEYVRGAFSLVPTLQLCAEVYAREYERFREHLNELASSDEEYKARDSWLNISHIRDELFLDFRWETAKNKSRAELEVCRKLLIVARQKYLESRRKAFNDGITDIWSTLRKDEYSTFSELVIPEPRGRGQKARLEVMAKLSSNSETQEVHALSVLSESQINAIGIAAFVTRSKLLGHKVLVFDDPVQSMDEDHFNSFADGVLSHLCDCGYQVIILTHNEDFAGAVNDWQSDHENRITMEIKHTPNKGVNVDEGHRSVSGLVSMSLANWNDGEYKWAWNWVRIAIERLFILIRRKHGQQPFDRRKWKKFTAKQMWNESIKDLLIPMFPDIARRMPAIVDWTVGGAHIRRASGFTDYSLAIDTIKDLQCKIEVGD